MDRVQLGCSYLRLLFLSSKRGAHTTNQLAFRELQPGSLYLPEAALCSFPARGYSRGGKPAPGHVHPLRAADELAGTRAELTKELQETLVHCSLVAKATGASCTEAARNATGRFTASSTEAERGLGAVPCDYPFLARFTEAGIPLCKWALLQLLSNWAGIRNAHRPHKASQEG